MKDQSDWLKIDQKSWMITLDSVMESSYPMVQQKKEERGREGTKRKRGRKMGWSEEGKLNHKVTISLNKKLKSII